MPVLNKGQISDHPFKGIKEIQAYLNFHIIKRIHESIVSIDIQSSVEEQQIGS